MSAINLKTFASIAFGGIALAISSTAAFAQAPTASSTLSRNPDGSVRISVKVTGPGVQDVHLCVARTKDSATEHTTMFGDPLGRNWSDPAGVAPPAGGAPAVPALPAGWSHAFKSTPDPNKQGESTWCHTWNNPGAALPGAGHTFVVDYSGGKDVKGSKAPNVILTKNGLPGYAPADVINGEGAAGSKKGEKGFMPVAVFPARLPVIPPERNL